MRKASSTSGKGAFNQGQRIAVVAMLYWVVTSCHEFSHLILKHCLMRYNISPHPILQMSILSQKEQSGLLKFSFVYSKTTCLEDLGRLIWSKRRVLWWNVDGSRTKGKCDKTRITHLPKREHRCGWVEVVWGVHWDGNCFVFTYFMYAV